MSKVEQWAQEILHEEPEEVCASEEQPKEEDNACTDRYNGGKSWIDTHTEVKAHVIGD